MTTPRTDEQAFVVYPYQIHGQIVGNKVVTVDFARQLETELAEARAEVERLKKNQESDAEIIVKFIKDHVDKAANKDRLIEKLAGALKELLSVTSVVDERTLTKAEEALQAYEESKRTIKPRRGKHD